MVDLKKIKGDKNMSLSHIDINVEEYMEMKQTLKDLETKNFLMLQQMKLLKS